MDDSDEGAAVELHEHESEQWQEVISKQSRRENNQKLTPHF